MRWLIGGSSNYTNGSLVSATSRSLLKLDQALNRGGWAGTLNTRELKHVRIDIRKRRPETVGTFSEHPAETGNTSLAE